jgi:hypothetical protein
MLQVGKQEQPDIVGHLKRIAAGIRHHQGGALLIEFQFAVGLDDFRAIAGGKTARKKAVAFSGQGIGDDRIAEGKSAPGKSMSACW